MDCIIYTWRDGIGRMDNNHTLAARQAYDEMRATFDQLNVLRRMIDDCSGKLKQTNDFEKRRALDRELNQLQREWDLVHQEFLSLNRRLNILVSGFLNDRPNPKLALSVASERRNNARTRDGTPEH
jgi:hypothetical protein